MRLFNLVCHGLCGTIFRREIRTEGVSGQAGVQRPSNGLLQRPQGCFSGVCKKKYFVILT
jgi:hypothetical protein